MKREWLEFFFLENFLENYIAKVFQKEKFFCCVFVYLLFGFVIVSIRIVAAFAVRLLLLSVLLRIFPASCRGCVSYVRR